MFRSSVTLYNKKWDSENRQDTYVRNVLNGVHWEDVRGVKLGETNLTVDDNTEIVIPMSLKGYINPIEFDKLATVSNEWTLQADDIVIKGNVDIPINDLFKVKHPQKRTIQSVSEVDYAITDYLNNWTVVAK